MCQLFLIDVIYVGLMFRLGRTARVNLETTTQALSNHFRAPPAALLAPETQDGIGDVPGVQHVAATRAGQRRQAG